MSPSLSRRSFLEFTAAAGGLSLASCAAAQSRRRTSGARLRHAGIGVGGMGSTDLDQIRAHAQVDVVALCDVDENNLRSAAERCPGARLYRDWRELLDKERGNIDSVHVSTPDHMHAAITLAALARGLHVYCQKPLTRTVNEARAVSRSARESGVVTQMGIQNHSNAAYDAALQLFRARHIGRVHEVHVWTDRPAGWWPQGVGRPEGQDEVPATLDWDKWIGVAPLRPFKKDTYHAFRWRGFKDFGTGAQGDMACHLMDPALWFLGLSDPLRVRSVGPRPNDETYPLWSTVHYEFPANDWTTRGPLLLTWRDGGKKVPSDLLKELGLEQIVDNGCLFVGEEGALLADPYGKPALYPAEKFGHIALPEGVARNHWFEWVEACLGRGETSAPFEYAAHLTEVALLGNVALRFPHETLDWNGGKGRFIARPDADLLLGAPQRTGWEIAELS
ncbi:MAG: Gfo/Idh/MocA family oxidoreductase [Planctomycetes bacterium]|nr:Gfo/Idh/MocA family oxidoreductase [Planctomycetota bacterium]